MCNFTFAVRSSLVQVGTDPEEGTPIIAESFGVICELEDGTRIAHDHEFLNRKQVPCEDYGHFWQRLPDGEAEAKAEALRARMERTVADINELDITHWSMIDPVYGSKAYQRLDAGSYFRDREIMEAHDAGEIGTLEASNLLRGPHFL